MTHLVPALGLALLLPAAVSVAGHRGTGGLAEQAAPADAKPDTQRPEPAREGRPQLRQGDVPIGSLGYPLGDYLTVKGVRADWPKSGAHTLLVDTINGKKLGEPIGIWVENIRELPKDVRVVLKGYETGQMGGPAPAAIKAAEEKGEDVVLPQRGWQWNAYFIALSAVEPKVEIQEAPTGFKNRKTNKDFEEKKSP